MRLVCLVSLETSKYVVGFEYFASDVKIVTDLPNNMFKRPKLNKYSNAGESSSVTRGGKKDGSRLFKPSFSRCIIQKLELHTSVLSCFKLFITSGLTPIL